VRSVVGVLSVEEDCAIVVLSAAGALCVVVVVVVEAATAPVFASEPDSAFSGVPEPGEGTVLPVFIGAEGEFADVVVSVLVPLCANARPMAPANETAAAVERSSLDVMDVLLEKIGK
jgi:hypothetical protein